jgi:hypothetical protein
MLLVGFGGTYALSGGARFFSRLVATNETLDELMK